MPGTDGYANNVYFIGMMNVSNGSVVFRKEWNDYDNSADALDVINGLRDDGKLAKKMRGSKKNVEAVNGTIHIQSDGDFVYFMVVKADYPERWAFKCLKEIMEKTAEADFVAARDKGSGQKVADSTFAGELVSKYDDVANLDQVYQIQKKVDATKEEMYNNINMAMQAGENLNALNDKTELLEEEAGMFKKQSTTLKNQAWWKNMKLNAIIGGIALVFIIFLIIMIM